MGSGLNVLAARSHYAVSGRFCKNFLVVWCGYSLRASVIDEIEAGEWNNCWHVAGFLFETPPESWSKYRERALKFYYSSDVEYHPQGSIPWKATQPPYLSLQSDLYWAMGVRFAETHSEGPEARRVHLSDIADSLGRIETATSNTGQHVLRTERNTDRLLRDVEDRLPPSREYWYQRLLEVLPPSVLGKLPSATTDHLIDASRHRLAREWDQCTVSLCKAVESLFVRILISQVQTLSESDQLKLAIPRERGAPRRYTERQWARFSIVDWSKVLGGSTESDINEPLRSTLLHAFPNVDLGAMVNLDTQLAVIARLRSSAAHYSGRPSEQEARYADELW